ncbi:MAG: hypothetical protein AAGF12_37660 [Myxococcota bacterium]
MKVWESRKHRRLLVSLHDEDSLQACLRRLIEEEALGTAWISGVGTVAWVELTLSEPARGAAPGRRIENATLNYLAGNLTLNEVGPGTRLRVLVEAEGELRAGWLVDAAPIHLELHVVAFDDILLQRGATGGWETLRPERRESGGADQAPTVAVPRPAPSSASPSGPVGWGDLAAATAEPEPPPKPAPRREPKKKTRRTKASPPAASAIPAFKPPPLPEKRRQKEAFLDEPQPEAGDYVDHQIFGKCRVDGEGPDGGLIIRLKSGVRKTIRLDFLQVLEPRVEDDAFVYPLRPRRR